MFHRIKVSDVRIQIGQLLRNLRKRERISQQELADRIGVSRVTVYNIETGKNANIDTWLLILEHFDALAEFSEFMRQQNDTIDTGSIY
jgi:transcriptional regulator with XRE-family HTH domain